MAGPLDFEAEELAQAAGAAPAIHGADMDGALVQYITSASSDPTVNDDAGDGYKVGLIWIRLDNNSRWQLDDSTVGAAVWSKMGGGATGGGNEVFVENGDIVSEDYTISTGRNAHSVGPITINAGITVTVPTGQRWLVS